MNLNSCEDTGCDKSVCDLINAREMTSEKKKKTTKHHSYFDLFNELIMKIND